MSKVDSGELQEHAVLLVLRQEPARGAQAHCRTDRVYLRRVRAEMIGTTRLRVSNFMNKFRDLGFISYNGSIEVHSSLLSVLLHDKRQIKSQDGVDPE